MQTSRKLALKASCSEQGFSLIEMMIAVILISAVMAVAVNGMMQMQQRNSAEASKTDSVQETRDFIDQVVRDIHDAGYPPARAVTSPAGVVPLCTNPTATINTVVRNSSSIACGIVAYSQRAVTYEGDLGDGNNVSVVTLDIVPASGSTCPCIVRRGVIAKTQWVTSGCNTNPTGSGCIPQYFTEVNGILNSGNGAGGSWGVTLSGPGTYTAYTTADVFDAYDVSGNSVAPCSLTTTPDCTSIRSLQITANVTSSYADPAVKTYPVFSITSKARLNF
jgi:prepilin-type N-terminal cleavage/methylation domain-containing protein